MAKRKGREGTVEIEHQGKKYEGRFLIERSVVTVFYGTRKQSTQTGGSSGEAMARAMLRELVQADPEAW